MCTSRDRIDLLLTGYGQYVLILPNTLMDVQADGLAICHFTQRWIRYASFVQVDLHLVVVQVISILLHNLPLNLPILNLIKLTFNYGYRCFNSCSNCIAYSYVQNCGGKNVIAILSISSKSSDNSIVAGPLSPENTRFVPATKVIMFVLMSTLFNL